MEKEIVLSAEQLCKTYQKNNKEKIVALDQLSFDLYQGEILGIIGNNGAGKSTLLKVLSQITPPSSGRVEYDGVLTSIIEVGTGFHPDLSGKDNVYLSANLLRQSNQEIDQFYDEIVDFSGLAEFMDMPIKHYSSGMYLRLAFAVAFYSKIDILLLDEVIAVGDVSFRRKCYEKIRTLKASGVAIILVSHSMDSITQFCDRCLWLENGKMKSIDVAMQVVEKYQEQSLQSNNTLRNKDQSKQNLSFQPISNEFLSIHKISINALGKPKGAPIDLEDEIEISLFCEKHKSAHSFEVIYSVTNTNDVKVLIDSYGLRKEYKANSMEKGEYHVRCTIPGGLLNRGIYLLGLTIGKDTDYVYDVPNIAQFRVQVGESAYDQQIASIIRPQLQWNIDKT